MAGHSFVSAQFSHSGLLAARAAQGVRMPPAMGFRFTALRDTWARPRLTTVWCPRRMVPACCDRGEKEYCTIGKWLMLIQPTVPVSVTRAKTVCAEDGLERQVLAFSERVMLVRHILKAGWNGVRHSHPHEQLVYVVRGRVQFRAGADAFEAVAGDSFVVPGGVEHQAMAQDDSEVLDVFVPYREDYAARNDER